MILPAYYNEHDPFAAKWLEALILNGHIAPGVVDTRDIRDVKPNDLRGYTQCHFFAGIGVWSYALRRAGWRDDRPVWTGSCPCQPFSAAGGRAGFSDERHLWPAWFHLITTAKERGVPVLGEQVASKDGLAWFDLISTDLEGAGYTVGAVDLCAAGVGAPHIRQRQWFVANPNGGHARQERQQRSRQYGQQPQDGSADRGLEHPASDGRIERWPESSGRGAIGGRGLGDVADTERDGFDGRGNAGQIRRSESSDRRNTGVAQGDASKPGLEIIGQQQARHQRAAVERTGPLGGFWRDAEWIYCSDKKNRPIEPGTFPLVNGASARVGRLRGYGNALNAEAATGFAEAAMMWLASQ